MSWLTPPQAARDGRWPLGRDAIRAKCEAYRLAVDRGRRPSPDDIECVRVGNRYRIQPSALDAWLRRQQRAA